MGERRGAGWGVYNMTSALGAVSYPHTRLVLKACDGSGPLCISHSLSPATV